MAEWEEPTEDIEVPETIWSSHPEGMKNWFLVAVVASLLGAGALLGGAAIIAEAGSGTLSSPSGDRCSGAVGGALLLFSLAGGLFGFTGWAVDRRTPGATVFDSVRLSWTLPIPVAMLVATAPAAAGCRSGRIISEKEAVASVLTGSPGLAIAAATCVLAGYMVATCLRWIPASDTLDDGSIDSDSMHDLRVDRALSQHEAKIDGEA